MEGKLSTRIDVNVGAPLKKQIIDKLDGRSLNHVGRLLWRAWVDGRIPLTPEAKKGKRHD